MNKLNRYIFLALAIFILPSIFSSLISIYPDILWFRSFGFESIWWFVFTSKAVVFSGFFAFAFLWLYVNFLVAKSICDKNTGTPKRQFNTPFKPLNAILSDIASRTVQPSPLSTQLARPSVLYAIVAGIAVAAVMFGMGAQGWWQDVYTYLHAQPFGVIDPIFGKDIGFYLFSIPFLESARNWLSGLLFITIGFVGWYYFSRNILLLIFSDGNERSKIKPHLFILIGLFCLLIAASVWINMHNMLTAENGSFFGAGYTDVHVRLFFLKSLVFLWIAEAALFFIAAFRQTIVLPIVFLLFIFLFTVGAGRFLPGIVQNYVVAPNELEKETPFINHGIRFTRMAYGLDKIQADTFPANTNLSMEKLQENDVTIRNIRLWNREPLKQTFSQLQEIRLYYEFGQVDVDRYMIDGHLQQVMLSARELIPGQLAQNAQTWINQHIVYTHGYGTVLSPVNEVTPEGLPHFYIKDLPPVTTPPFTITQPQIYFGERTNDYAIVNTKEPEFDYPKGDNNVYTHYDGKGGIQLSSFLRKLIFALKFSESKLIFNQDITSESRLLYDRNITQIVRKLAPFIYFDRDPYLVITEAGRQVWMLDGYTASDKFPYSERYGRNLNYIRNAVKASIDAHSGEVKFYIADTNDPIIKTYSSIYKDLFTPFSDMPSDLKDHVRYPKDLFSIQMSMYRTYHMTDTKVFYNKEDVWDIPLETYDSNEKVMDAYYLVTKIPGETKESFVLMLPFTPTNKNNMISWMAAKCDIDDYGTLKVFKFPKERTIFGPMQIESRIDQDTEISQKLTLWDQAGSRVIRGNLMVIPVEDSLIYAEPIYLQATQSKLPELKRVIFAYGDSVIMGDNLNDAINQTFDGNYQQSTPGTETQESPSLIKTIATKLDANPLIKRVISEYNKLKSSAQNANWAAFGKGLDDLGTAIEDLSKEEN